MASEDGEKATDEEEQGPGDCSSKMIPRIKSVLFSFALRGGTVLSTASDPFHRDVSLRWKYDKCDVGSLVESIRPRALVNTELQLSQLHFSTSRS
jgi:hypothetical protein